MPKRDHPRTAHPGDPDWNIDGLSWPCREDSEFWRVGGFLWHVQRRGHGPTMLLLHGTGASTHSWAPLIERLNSRFQTINVDLPGHGFTQTPRGFRPTIGNVSLALVHLLNDLAAVPDLIVGHSAGAAIAMQLAVPHNLKPRLVVSINGALKSFGGMMRMIAPMTAKLASMGGLAASLVAKNSTTEERVRNLVRQIGSNPDLVDTSSYTTLLQRRGHVQGALRMMAHWDLSEIEALNRSVSQPMTFIAGSADRAVSPNISKEAAGRALDGTYFELPLLGHLAHEEDPATIADTIASEWHRVTAKC